MYIELRLFIYRIYIRTFAHFNLEIPLNEPSTTATSSLSTSQTGEKAISL